MITTTATTSTTIFIDSGSSHGCRRYLKENSLQFQETQIQEAQMSTTGSCSHPVEEKQERTELESAAGTGQSGRKLFAILFYGHIFLITILTIFLIIRGAIVAVSKNHFLPLKWFLPLLASTGCSAIVAFSWQFFTHRNPAKAVKAAFWLSPLLTCSVGILLVFGGSTGSSVAAAFTLVFSFVQSLYACWVHRRFTYAARVLSISIASPPAKTASLVTISISAGFLHSCFMITGIGGATVTSTGLDTLFILVILLSLTWTMHVAKNILHVTISLAKYMQFASGTDFDIRVALRNTLDHSMGSVCLGSAVVPVLSVIRGSARGLSSFAGDTDEFLFSCASCYSGIASRLVSYGNRWGFVHVGVYQKGFVQASMDTWEMFRRVGIEGLINSDLTGSFCFLCGVAGGAMSSLVGGTWAILVHKDYATEITFCAFLIGYLLTRLAMAWPQACVSAYYVAYSENPQSLRFESIIPDRLQQLRRYEV